MGARRSGIAQLYLSPEAEHLLDWFHITMRLTTLTQTAKGLPATTSLEGRTLRDDVVRETVFRPTPPTTPPSCSSRPLP